jgi:hypothetical protein
MSNKIKKLKKGLKDAFCEIARLDAELSEIKKNPILNIERVDKITSPFDTVTVNLGSGLSNFDEKEAEEFELGKWYKSKEDDNFLLYVLDILDLDNVRGYGFDKYKQWNDDDSEHGWCLRNKVLATEEEVENALIKEAKKRGFSTLGNKFVSSIDDGGHVRVISPFCGESVDNINKFYFDVDGYLRYKERINVDDGLCSNPAIFKDGVWVDIVTEPKEHHEEIDWSKPAQLVCNVDRNIKTILLAKNAYNSKYFSGTCVKECINDNTKIGEVYFRNKKDWQIYTGEPITLSND